MRYGIGRPIGDPFVLAGSFVVHGNAVHAEQRADSTGTIPDLARLFDAATALETEQAI